MKFVYKLLLNYQTIQLAALMNASVKSVFNWPFSHGDGVRLFLCGDVMTGRGVDQILPNPSKPILYEPYVRNANDYVHLAEVKNGKLPKK